MEIGTANYEGERRQQKVIFKMKDGDNIYRILPPLGSMAKDGRYFKYYRVEWGYKTTDGKLRPFLDARKVNFDTKEVEIESAAHIRREEIALKKKNLYEALRKEPTNETLKSAYKAIQEESERYNLESKYYLNAVDSEGKIGLLKIGSRAMAVLKEQIEIRKKTTGKDPLSIEGVYFNFYRTGKNTDTVYTVTPHRELLQDGNERIKTHTMDAAFIARLDKEAYDLGTMYPVVSAEDVARMVNEGPTAVDEILGKKKEDGKPAAAAPTAPAVKTEEQKMNELLSKVNMGEPTLTETPKASAPAPEAASADPLKEFKEMTEEEFLKSIGV